MTIALSGGDVPRSLYQVTRKALYRRVVEETLAYVLREMAQPRGGYSGDSGCRQRGRGGGLLPVVEGRNRTPVCRRNRRGYSAGTTMSHRRGTSKGRTFFTSAPEMTDLAAYSSGSEVDELQRRGRPSAGNACWRCGRSVIRPARDDKIVVAWNGLMISAMARAHAVLGNRSYLDSAAKPRRALILSELRSDSTGALMHSFKGREVERERISRTTTPVSSTVSSTCTRLPTNRVGYGRQLELAAQMVERFWDPGGSSFLLHRSRRHGDLIVRSKNPFDNATPSGNSMAALAMMRLGALTGDESLWEKGVRTVGSFSGLLERSPTSCPQMGCAFDFSLQKPLEIAVAGESSLENNLLLRRGSRALSFRTKLCAVGRPAYGRGCSCHEETERLVPLLAGKCSRQFCRPLTSARRWSVRRRLIRPRDLASAACEELFLGDAGSGR